MAMRNRGRHWRKAAAEAKAIAESTHDAEAKRIMLEIAERYEVLAKYSESEAEMESDD